jgi:hypothetical protein
MNIAFKKEVSISTLRIRNFSLHHCNKILGCKFLGLLTGVQNRKQTVIWSMGGIKEKACLFLGYCKDDTVSVAYVKCKWEDNHGRWV